MAAESHHTVHVRDAMWFIAGCTCDWIGERRSTLQAVTADQTIHLRDAARSIRTNFRVTPCEQQGCPIC